MSTETAKPVRKHKTSVLLKRFIPYYKKHLGSLILDLFCASFTVVCELALPIIARNITDTGINHPELLTFSYIGKIALFYLILRAFDCAANYYMQAGGHIMGTKMETEMRRDMFAHLQSLPYSYYDDTKIGQIMSRITSDLFDITEFAHHCPEEYFIASLKFIGSFIYLARINLKLTLLMFILVPLMAVISSKYRKQMRSAFKAQRHELGEINAGVEDTLLGIRVVKSFANEDVEKEKFKRTNTRFFNVKKSAYYSMAGFNTTIRLFDGLMYILVVCAGAVFIMKKEIFDDYCKWLFDILLELENRVDITNYSDYDKRIYGFLSERLFRVWLEKNNNIKIKEMPVYNTEQKVFPQRFVRTIQKILVR